MAQKNKMLGLALVGGAGYLLLKGAGASETPSQLGGGGSSGGFIIPSGFGSSEISNPNSQQDSGSFAPPTFNIYESEPQMANAPTDSKSSTITTKKDAFGSTGIYSDGKLVGVEDAFAQQSRLPTPAESLTNTFSSGGGSSSSSTKKSSGGASTSSSGSVTGTFQGLKVSVPATSTKKDSGSSSGSSSIISKIGGAIGSLIKKSIFR
jgi:hypothetical protein